MSITTEVSKNIYTCNGATVFPYMFKIIDETHLEVTYITEAGVETILTLNTDYTVSGVGDSSGEIELSSAPSEGTLVIRRVVLLKQLTEFDNQGGYYPKTNEDAVDYVTMISQMNKELLDRVLVQGVDKTTPLVIPSPEAGKILIANSSTELDWTDPSTPYPPSGAISFVLDGGGFVLPTGIAVDIYIPFNLTFTLCELLSDRSGLYGQTGSIVLDLWKKSYADFPPTVADSIVASAKPTISAGIKAKDITLTGWTVDLNEGDIIRVNVDSVASITRLTGILGFTRR